MNDFGYDVSDYRNVDPLFGNLENFDTLIAEAHERDIKVLIDFVPNHTSSDHPWFKAALESRDNPYRDYYIFKDPKSAGSETHTTLPPNNWLSVFGGSAWEYDGASGQYYYHAFLAEQPDLNWENPAVQEEMANIIRFWFDRGVDGIRVDAIRWMGKDLEFRDDPENPHFKTGQDPYHMVRHIHSRFGPRQEDYLRVMTSVAREYEDKIIIWEDHRDTLTPVPQQIKRIHGVDPEVSAPFIFEPMHTPFSSQAFANMVNTNQQHLGKDLQPFYCFGNHDEHRLVTRFGEKQARMLAVMQLMLPGTPVLYYGQELGMPDATIHKDQVQDPFEKRVPDRGLGRDPERSPMPWNNGPNAGFTTAATPWLPLIDDYRHINVETELEDKNSFLWLHKTLLDLRREHPVFYEPSYEHAYVDDAVFAFWRTNETEQFLTILNFSESEAEFYAPEGGKLVVSAQGHDYDDQLPVFAKINALDGVVLRYG